MDAEITRRELTPEEKGKRALLKEELAGVKAKEMLAFEARAVREFGPEAGIFCRQSLFWEGRGADPTGFIWKSEAEWREETGLSRWAQRKARKRLKARGVLEEDRRGVPYRLFFRLDLRKLMETVGPYAKDEGDKTDEGEPGSSSPGSGDDLPATLGDQELFNRAYSRMKRLEDVALSGYGNERTSDEYINAIREWKEIRDRVEGKEESG